jgi:heme/copper-type cytochrome/quinol oxidase subunit 3
MSADASLRWDELPRDDRRGTRAMTWFIATEAALFVALFFAYFYLGSGPSRWPPDPPPKLPLALIMLLVLLASSGSAAWGEAQARQGRLGGARAGIGLTVLLGLGFLALQVREYLEHFKTLRPQDDAYASVFYTITSVHGLHVGLGLLMLTYAAVLPDPQGAHGLPHRPLRTAALYWHFVDAVWVLIVLLLYLLPHWTGGA